MSDHSALGWRRRVLDRLDESRGALRVAIPAARLERMYAAAEGDAPAPNASPIEAQTAPAAPAAERIAAAPCSYLQRCATRDVPYHYQIVAPGAAGTAAAGAAETYEVAVWVRTLILLCYAADTGAVFFEHCTGAPPLVIDVFPAPTDGETLLYWRSALSETATEVGSLVPLRGWTLRRVFPRGAPYVAVLLDEGGGLAKLWEGGDAAPRAMAVDVVAALWRASRADVPPGLDAAVRSSCEWPK